MKDYIDRRLWEAWELSIYDPDCAKRIEDAWKCPNCDEVFAGVVAPEECSACKWSPDPRYVAELDATIEGEG